MYEPRLVAAIHDGSVLAAVIDSNVSRYGNGVMPHEVVTLTVDVYALVQAAVTADTR